MKKLKFLSVLTLIAMLFTMAVSAADIYVFDFEECDNKSDIVDSDAGEMFETHIGVGTVEVRKRGGKGMGVRISSITEMRTVDVIEGEYVFSLDYTPEKVSDSQSGEGIFIKGVIPGVVTKDNSDHRQPSQTFPYCETDWYASYTGYEIDSQQMGGSGIYVQLRYETFRINIKTYTEEALNIGQQFVDIPYPEGITFKGNQVYNIKFYDELSKVTVFLNNIKIATIDLSDAGKMYDGIEDYEYYGKAVVSNAAGEQILTVTDTRVSSMDSQLAIAARASTVWVDNIKLYVGDDAVETDMNGENPGEGTDTTDAGTTDAGATDTTVADTTVADTTVADTTAADTTASDTAADDGEGSNTALIIGIIAGVVVVAAVVAVVVMKKKK